MNVRNIIFGISKRYEGLIRINVSLWAGHNNSTIYDITIRITDIKNIQIIGTNNTYFSVFNNNHFTITN